MVVNVLAGNAILVESIPLALLILQTVVGDVLITVVSCFLLHKARNSFQRHFTFASSFCIG